MMCKPTPLSPNVEMATSSKGVNFIKSFETCALESYVDTHDDEGSALYAIGYFHTTKRGYPLVREGMVVTEGQAEQILIQDLKPHERFVRTYVTVPLNQNQFDALVSFSFNVNPGCLRAVVLNSGLNKKNYDQVPAQLMIYSSIEGEVSQAMVKRREAEVALFNSPVEEA